MNIVFNTTFAKKNVSLIVHWRVSLIGQQLMMMENKDVTFVRVWSIPCGARLPTLLLLLLLHLLLLLLLLLLLQVQFNRVARGRWATHYGRHGEEVLGSACVVDLDEFEQLLLQAVLILTPPITII